MWQRARGNRKAVARHCGRNTIPSHILRNHHAARAETNLSPLSARRRSLETKVEAATREVDPRISSWLSIPRDSPPLPAPAAFASVSGIHTMKEKEKSVQTRRFINPLAYTSLLRSIRTGTRCIGHEFLLSPPPHSLSHPLSPLLSSSRLPYPLDVQARIKHERSAFCVLAIDRWRIATSRIAAFLPASPLPLLLHHLSLAMCLFGLSLVSVSSRLVSSSLVRHGYSRAYLSHDL